MGSWFGVYSIELWIHAGSWESTQTKAQELFEEIFGFEGQLRRMIVAHYKRFVSLVNAYLASRLPKISRSCHELNSLVM